MPKNTKEVFVSRRKSHPKVFFLFSDDLELQQNKEVGTLSFCLWPFLYFHQVAPAQYDTILMTSCVKPVRMRISTKSINKVAKTNMVLVFCICKNDQKQPKEESAVVLHVKYECLFNESLSQSLVYENQKNKFVVKSARE